MFRLYNNLCNDIMVVGWNTYSKGKCWRAR
nr:MAG TPA: hypothetical protein [Caudoviricetes sp.]